MNATAQAPIRSACKCGQTFLIEHDAGARTCRADGKRVFYPDQVDDGWCAYRCQSCIEPVDETVPGAQFDDAVLMKESIHETLSQGNQSYGHT